VPTLAFLNQIGGWEWLIIGGVALLIFGKRLPDVGRSVGRSIVEFRKGLKGIEDDIETQSNTPSGRVESPKPLSDAKPVDPNNERRVSREDPVAQ